MTAFDRGSYTFPTGAVGDTHLVVLTLTASGATEGVVAVTGADFALSSSREIALTEAGATSRVTVSFSPTTAGTATGSLTFTPTSGAALTVSLTAEVLAGDPFIEGHVTSLAFSSVTVGTSALSSLVLRAPTGDDSQTYTFTIGDPGAPFSVSPLGEQGIADGGMLVLSVTYEPTAVGASSATLSLPWTQTDGSSGTFSVALTGTGIADDVDDDASTADGTSSATGGSVTDSTQRVVLAVPTATSVVGLGYRYTVDGKTLTEDGFTASTSAHIAFNADKAVTFQAKDLVWLQSNEDSTHTISGGSSYWMSDSSVYLAGGDYVGIMAGYHGDPSKKGSGEIMQGFLTADILWGVFEKLINIANYAKWLHMQIYLDKWNEEGWGGLWAWLMRGWIILKSIYTFGSIAFWVTTRSLGSVFKALSIYSEAGLIMGTPTVTTISAGISANYRSLSTTLFGLAGVSLEAGYSVQLDSVWGETAVTAGKSLSIKSGLDTKLVSRTGAITLAAPRVYLGDLEGSALESQTKDIEVDAASEIAMVSKTPGIGMVELSSQLLLGGTLSMAAKSAATLSADVETLIDVGGVFKIAMAAGSITITSALGKVVELAPAMITLGPGAGQIKLLSALADVGGAVKMTPASIVASAPLVEVL